MPSLPTGNSAYQPCNLTRALTREMVVTEHVLGNPIERTNMEGLNHNLIQITYYSQAHSFYETLQMRYVPAQDIKEHSEVNKMTFCFSFLKEKYSQCTYRSTTNFHQQKLSEVQLLH